MKPHTSSAGLPIGELKRRIAALESVSGLRRWSRVLRGDSRAGARALGEQCWKRARAREAERRRMRRLFALREQLGRDGARAIAGVDEVGVGPLAGPVVAAAVILPARVRLPGLNDSKQLSRAQRERLATAIRSQCVAYGVGEVEPEEIDRLNIYRASLEAMRRAVQALACTHPPDHLLVDARRVPDVVVAQTPLVNGDALDGSIAAASIIAKVHRDALMRELDTHQPGYGFGRHMGYATAEHLAALERLGASPAHRRSFAPVAAALR